MSERITAVPLDDPCSDGEGGWDHDLVWIADWYGDPGVINGTADCSHYRCRRCGHEEDGDPPEDDFEDYDD